MINFWQGLGGKLADRWAATVLTPAFVFWGGGFLAWITYVGWASLKPLGMQFEQLSPVLQGILVIGGLLAIAVSSIAVERLDLTTLRVLEGYWPGWLTWLRDWIVRLQNKSLKKVRRRYDRLVMKEVENKLSLRELRERTALDLRLELIPTRLEDRMPTKLGNILREAENRPLDRYGLVTAICWPRLWLLLSDDVKKELTEARANLNTAARMFLWSILFLVWSIWAWWVPIVTLVGAFWAYRWALSAATIYGDLLVSAFDLNRFSLYETLRWPLPQNSKEEWSCGQQLTEYLFRGPIGSPVTFQKPEGKDKGKKKDS